MLIEINIGNLGIEAPQDDPRWIGYDLLIAEGSTIEELVDGAVVWFSDQDGGEAGSRPLEELPSVDIAIFTKLLIQEYIERQYSKAVSQ